MKDPNDTINNPIDYKKREEMIKHKVVKQNIEHERMAIKRFIPNINP